MKRRLALESFVFKVGTTYCSSTRPVDWEDEETNRKESVFEKFAQYDSNLEHALNDMRNEANRLLGRCP